MGVTTLAGLIAAQQVPALPHPERRLPSGLAVIDPPLASSSPVDVMASRRHCPSLERLTGDPTVRLIKILSIAGDTASIRWIRNVVDVSHLQCPSESRAEPKGACALGQTKKPPLMDPMFFSESVQLPSQQARDDSCKRRPIQASRRPAFRIVATSPLDGAAGTGARRVSL